MECHDVRQLLAFVDRKCEELDAPERAALAQHLERCPECAALAQAEREFDQALGAAVRAVAVPPGLQPKILAKLATQPRGTPWKPLAAAAAIFIAVTLLGAGIAWKLRDTPAVSVADIRALADQENWDLSVVEQHLSEQGVPVEAPRDFDYRNLQHVDVAEFRGQRVPKLTFASRDGKAVACVLVLSPARFRLGDLHDGMELPGTTSIRIHHDRGHVNVIFYRGDLGALQRLPDQ
ncbi:MAG: hypothetical protein HYX68_12450 [Planctomycetes bacterium]|nr:hypothetical protein [Planctomycetota bacterium]